MQISQPLEIGARQPGAAESGDRATQRRVRARRFWAIRSSLLLVTSAVLLCIFVMWRRDSFDRNLMLQDLRTRVAALQAQIDELGVLPASLPPQLEDLPSYANAADRFFALNSETPTVIGFTRPRSLMLRQDGRCVILYKRGQVSVVWVTESEFRRQIREQQERMTAFEKERHARPPELP